MNFTIALILLVFVALRPLEVWSLKRIKRNSLKETKNTRIKQDFVPLHRGKQDSEEHVKPDSKVLETPASYNSSNDRSLEFHKKRNVSRPLAVILREMNERQKEDVAGIKNAPSDVRVINQAIENNLEKTQAVMDKRCDASGNPKEFNKHVKQKHSPHMLHSTSVVGAQSFGVLNPIATLDKLMKFGNMMMFKVGLENQQSYSPKMIMAQNSPQLLHQRNLYQQINEPNFDYMFNAIEGPLEEATNEKTLIKAINPSNLDEKATVISSPTIFLKTAATENEPTQLANLMQTALDTLMSNSEKNESEIEWKCPLHLEKKSTQNAGDDADVIQVCSCRFIKGGKEAIKQKN